MNEELLNFMQQHLGYTDEEMESFRSNPKNLEILSKVPALMQKTIVSEVVASHGCNSQHQVGEKFYFDGVGNLLSKLNAYALFGPLYVANELFYAGVDPNDMRLNRVGCFDVGVRCGGWGRIALEVRMEDRK